MKELWTEEVGKGIAMISKSYSLVSYVWSSMGIGPEIMSWLETANGRKEAKAALQLVGEKFLATQSVAARIIPGSILTTVATGKVQSVSQLWDLLSRDNYTSIGLLHEVFQKLEIDIEEKTVYDAWEVRVDELGFTDPVTLTEVCLHAHTQYGFRYCTIETAVLIRIMYKGQQRRILAMGSIFLNTLLVRLELSFGSFGTMLNVVQSEKDYIVLPHDVIVFIRPHGE